MKSYYGGPIGSHQHSFDFFGSPPYFYFWFCLYGHRDGRFGLIFARTALQSVLDGTNGLSSSEPCAYCRIVQICQKYQGASRGHLCDSTAFLYKLGLYNGYNLSSYNCDFWPMLNFVILSEFFTAQKLSKSFMWYFAAWILWALISCFM